MKKEFYDLAWEQIEYWQNQDKKTLKKSQNCLPTSSATETPGLVILSR